MRRRFLRPVSLVLATAAVGLTMSVDDGLARSTAPTKVQVKITARACKLSRKRVAPGVIVFVLANKSKVPHSLAIAGKRSKSAKPRKKSKFQDRLGKPGKLPSSRRPRKKTPRLEPE